MRLAGAGVEFCLNVVRRCGVSKMIKVGSFICYLLTHRTYCEQTFVSSFLVYFTYHNLFHKKTKQSDSAYSYFLPYCTLLIELQIVIHHTLHQSLFGKASGKGLRGGDVSARESSMATLLPYCLSFFIQKTLNIPYIPGCVPFGLYQIKY